MALVTRISFPSNHAPGDHRDRHRAGLIHFAGDGRTRDCLLPAAVAGGAIEGDKPRVCAAEQDIRGRLILAQGDGADLSLAIGILVLPQQLLLRTGGIGANAELVGRQVERTVGAERRGRGRQ